MSTASRPYPIMQDLIESFASWLKHRRELNEMRQLDRADFDRAAAVSAVSADPVDPVDPVDPAVGDAGAGVMPTRLDQRGDGGQDGVGG